MNNLPLLTDALTISLILAKVPINHHISSNESQLLNIQSVVSTESAHLLGQNSLASVHFQLHKMH